MASPEELHNALRDYDEFSVLLEELDTPGTIDQFRGVVDAYGDSTSKLFKHEFQELTLREAGLLRIAWEAHNQEFEQPRRQPRQ